MARVEITKPLFEEKEKKFKKESLRVFDLLETLEVNPRKGKELGTVGGILIKEMKYQQFRFYFITDGHALRFSTESELVDLLLRFVRMSDKKHQQETIDEIKAVLRRIGPSGFD